MRTALPIFAALFLALAFSAASAHADKPSKEYLIKAAFLYNFTKFVEWPTDTANLNICIFGKDNFGRAVNAITKKSTAERHFQIHRNPDQQTTCHIAYLSPEATSTQAQQLHALTQKPVLTVGDDKSFIAKGGIVSFILVDNKVKLLINIAPARRSGLKIDSQLLEVALRVIDEE